MDMIQVDATEVATLIGSLEASHIVVQMEMNKDSPDWERIRKWEEWRQEYYLKLKAMGIPVFNPKTDAGE